MRGVFNTVAIGWAAIVRVLEWVFVASLVGWLLLAIAGAASSTLCLILVRIIFVSAFIVFADRKFRASV